MQKESARDGGEETKLELKSTWKLVESPPTECISLFRDCDENEDSIQLAPINPINSAKVTMKFILGNWNVRCESDGKEKSVKKFTSKLKIDQMLIKDRFRFQIGVHLI